MDQRTQAAQDLDEEIDEHVSLVDRFHELEKKCVGFENFINCEDKYYMETLEKLRQLVIEIQRESIFSDNENIKEIETDHIKLLMIPYYEADTLYRIMDNRVERVKLAQTFYLEYLKLTNHYGLLDKEQKAKWKAMAKEAYTLSQDDALEKQEPVKTYGPINFDHFINRDEKISMFQRKKELEHQLDLLKNYQDDDMRRDYYLMQLNHSVVRSLEQLGLIFQELKLLEHQQTLPRDEHGRPTQDNTGYVKKPLKIVKIPKREDMPYLLAQQADEQNPDGSVFIDPTNPAEFQKVKIQTDTIEQKAMLRHQFQNQVFKPGHILPTMSIEELAEAELADALDRQKREEEFKQQRDEEDPESEEVLERERKKQSASDDWKDWNPKGAGNTKRM